MNVCKDCGNPLDAAGFTNGCLMINCAHDRRRFEAEVESSRQALTLELLEKISKNEMPECFVATRAATVAMAGLLMETLRQNQTMAEELQTQIEATRH